MQKLLIVLTIAMAVGCQSNADKTTVADSVITANNINSNNAIPADDAIANITGCYMQILKRDTFAANLQQQGNVVTGKLSFDNYEKDGSSGSVTGKLEADILKLKYAFSSEGMHSVMEVYFKYKDGNLIRGIGDMNTKGDSSFFINPATIKYDGTVLKNISCEILPGKFK